MGVEGHRPDCRKPDLADWPVASLLRRVMALWLQRQPVARRLLTPSLSDLE